MWTQSRVTLILHTGCDSLSSCRKSLVKGPQIDQGAGQGGQGSLRVAVLTGRTSPVVLVYCRASPKSNM